LSDQFAEFPSRSVRPETFEPKDPNWRAIADFELPKIAMRSMEHGSHPGRFLNDFRKQFSGSPVVYSTILSYGPPGRIFSELLSLFIFERLIFGSYYANVERPFIHFPARPEDEPQDFMPGAEQMETLLPYIQYLAQEIARFFRNIDNSFDGFSVWSSGLREIERLTKSLAAGSPRFEIPTKVFDDTALIKYQPEDVILEFRQLERFTKILLYAVREEDLPCEDKGELLAQVLSVLTIYHKTLDARWGGILYQNRSTGVRQDMRGRAAEYVFSACSLVHAELTALLSDAPPPAIPENPEEPAAGQTMDIDLFREMVTYSVDAEAFIASKIMAAEIAEDRVQFAQGRTLMKDLNLTQIVRSLPDQIKPEGAEVLEAIVPGDVDLFVRGNERRVRGMFTNIITNSFQFGKRVRVRLEYDPASQKATVRLSDNGRGIHPDLLTWDDVSRRVTIFKLGETRRRADLGAQAGGTGVGTTESFWDAEMHGGSLTLEETVRSPNPAQGTTFLFELPAEARSLWERVSSRELLALLESKYSVETVGAVEESLSSITHHQRELIEAAGFILRESGDSLNRDDLRYVNALTISESLLVQDPVTVRLALSEFLLPMELDRIDSRMFTSSNAAARRAVSLLRVMARLGNMDATQRERVFAALEKCEREGSQGEGEPFAPLTPLLRAAMQRDLAGRERLALARAIEEQGRTYLATEGLDRLYREAQQLSEHVRGVFIRRPSGTQLQRLLATKSIALVEAIQGRLAEEGEGATDPQVTEAEREHLLDFVSRSLVESVGDRLGDFPVDWRSLVVYLAEHGVMGRVLEQLPLAEVGDWLREMNRTLPLVAAFLDPQIHGTDFEQAIDDPNTPVHTRLMLKSDLPQVAMLTDATRVREVYEFLSNRGVKPKPRGPEYVRPIFQRIVEATRQPDDDNPNEVTDRILQSEPTTHPTNWEGWLTYLAKLHTPAVLSQVSMMDTDDLRRLRAQVCVCMVISDELIESGLFDHLLEHYFWWQESIRFSPERFDHLVAQVTQMHAQTTMSHMEDALLFAVECYRHWAARAALDSDLSEPAVDSGRLLQATRDALAQPWAAELSEPIRLVLQQAVHALTASAGEVSDTPTDG